MAEVFWFFSAEKNALLFDKRSKNLQSFHGTGQGTRA
jgi:hypothetical protein